MGPPESLVNLFLSPIDDIILATVEGVFSSLSVISACLITPAAYE